MYHHHMQNVQTEFEALLKMTIIRSHEKMFSIQNFQVAHCWNKMSGNVDAHFQILCTHLATPNVKTDCKIDGSHFAKLWFAWCVLYSPNRVTPFPSQHYRPVVSNGSKGAIAGKLKHTHTHTSVKLQSEGNADRDTVRVKGVVVNIVWPSKFTYLEFWSRPTHSHHGFGFLSIAKKLILASLEYLLFSNTNVQGCDNTSCYLCQ